MNTYTVHADAITLKGEGPVIATQITVDAENIREGLDVATAILIKQMPDCTVAVWSIELNTEVEDDAG